MSNNEKLLAEAFEILNPDFIEQYRKQVNWEKTNREHLMKLNIKGRGEGAEKIIHFICYNYDIPFEISSDNKDGYDITINGKPTEIKYSCISADGGFTFNQLRPYDETYEYVLFFFLAKDWSKFYTVKRTDILENFIMSGQHDGDDGRTRTISSTVHNMKAFEKCGNGEFEDAIKRIV